MLVTLNLTFDLHFKVKLRKLGLLCLIFADRRLGNYRTCIVIHIKHFRWWPWIWLWEKNTAWNFTTDMRDTCEFVHKPGLYYQYIFNAKLYCFITNTEFRPLDEMSQQWFKHTIYVAHYTIETTGNFGIVPYWNYWNNWNYCYCHVRLCIIKLTWIYIYNNNKVKMKQAAFAFANNLAILLEHFPKEVFVNFIQLLIYVWLQAL